MDATLDATLLLDVLQGITPPLSAQTMSHLASVLPEHRVSLSVARALTSADYANEPFNISSPLERARITSGLTGVTCSPPPTSLLGGPVVVRPKIGFTRLGEINTLTGTASCRFFLDLYWRDPRIAGRSYVPDGTWRPADVYIFNQYGTGQYIPHAERPIIADVDENGLSRGGLLLWPIEFEGTVTNPMCLRSFPFDFDSLDLFIHQAESSSSSEYVLRGFDDDDDEQASVRFFFSVGETLSEWQLRGFSRTCWESVGGVPTAFSKCIVTLHLARNYKYYAWKVVLPLGVCTVFCFASFFFVPDELEARCAISTTMFLATAALLYVIGTEVPKTAYLTVIDKLVVATLLIQFLIVLDCVLVGGSLDTDDVNLGLSAFNVRKDLAEEVDRNVFWALFVALVLSFVAFFAWPAWWYAKCGPDDWPRTLQRGSGGTLQRLLSADGTWLKGWTWTPADDGSGRKPVRYLRFREFINIFPSIQPGSEPPGRLPDPPNLRELHGDKMAVSIAGKSAEHGASIRSNDDHLEC